MLKEHGYSPKTLGWNKKRHNLRYYILLSQWDLNEKSVLDFGCGFGDMYAYLKNNGINANYYGTDINENLITKGKEIYPEANLFHSDALSNGLSRDYDYIFSSGVHNFKFADNWSYIQNTFEFFNKYSKLGFATNFISDKVDFREDDIYYSNPGMVIELAYKYSNKIVLRNDYMPFEFTVFISKNNAFRKETATYTEFEKYILR